MPGGGVYVYEEGISETLVDFEMFFQLSSEMWAINYKYLAALVSTTILKTCKTQGTLLSHAFKQVDLEFSNK